MPGTKLSNNTSAMWNEIEERNNQRKNAAEKAALEGNAQACYEMAKRYRHGWLVTQNYHKAFESYKTAAEQKHASACYDLARLYMEGHDLMNIKMDFDKAEHYATLGAKISMAGDNKFDDDQDVLACRGLLHTILSCKEVFKSTMT